MSRVWRASLMASALIGASPRALHMAPTAAADTTRFVVDGIPVILRRVVSNDVVSANVYLLGGVRQVTDETAGIEPFLLDVSERGTLHYPQTVLRRDMARLGTTIVVDPQLDWTIVGARATSSTFDSTWAIMADRLMAPRLDSADVEIIREQYLSAVRQRDDNADALVEWLADSAAFAGTPYGRSLVGTERSISGLSRSTLRQYETTQMVRSRLLIVIVGNVDAAHVQRLVHASLGRLPAGTYQWTIPAAMRPITTTLVTRSRALPTNYILGYFHGPPAKSPDYEALRLATSALSGQLFADIRTRRNLSYAVNAPFLDHAVSAGGLYVTTTQPDTVLNLMRSNIILLQANLVDPTALDHLVQQFITEYFLDNETDADQANFLARAELYQGDYRDADRFVDDLRRVTPSDIQRVARTYMRDVAFAYVGDTTKVSREAVEVF